MTNMAPAAVGKRIAADIRKHGHFKGTTQDKGVCIVTSANFPTAEFKLDFISTLREHIGLPVPPRPWHTDDIINWNDTTETDTVLAKLESMPVGTPLYG